jgi:predicted MFS family arabinose efflux permease
MLAARTRRLEGAALVAVTCFSGVLAMTSVAHFSVLTVQLMHEWSLTEAQAGIIGGAYFAGNALAVPFLVGSTDVVDSRTIFVFSSLLSAAASALFAILAQGFWSSVLLRAVAGVALAGTYMPGLSIITARLPPAARARATPYYTASFSLGNAASYILVGQFSDADTWRVAFGASAVCACAAAVLVALLVAPLPPLAADGFKLRELFAYRQVFANKPAMGYILSYGGHAWELLAFRQWLVPFLVFKGVSAPTASIVAFSVMCAGAAASVCGGELARAPRMGGRRRVLFILLTFSLLTAALVASSAVPAVPHWAAITGIVLYGLATISDSGAVTAGTVAHAAPGRQGITLSLHSMVGFTFPSMGTAAAGAVLQAGGGKEVAIAWFAAWLTIAAGGCVSLLSLKLIGCEQHCCSGAGKAADDAVELRAARDSVEEHGAECDEKDTSVMLPARARSDGSAVALASGDK